MNLTILEALTIVLAVVDSTMFEYSLERVWRAGMLAWSRISTMLSITTQP